MDTIGSRIKKERKRAGMTQAELAKKICKGKSTVQKYELNIVSPSADVLQLFAAALKCSTSNFFPECPRLTDYVRPTEKTLDEMTGVYQSLNDKGRAEAVKRIKELAQLPQYTEREGGHV